MPPRPQGSRWFQNLLLVIFIAAVALGAKPVYHKIMVKSANLACLKEAEAYAQKTRRAFQIRVPRSSPPNADCSSITDVSAGGSLDTDIIAKPHPPGDVTFHCDLNAGASCMEA